MGMRRKNKSFDARLHENRRLARIQESPFEGSDDEHPTKKGKILLPKLSEHPLESLNFFDTWMYQLSKSPSIFKYFIRKALANRILSNPKAENIEGLASEIDRNPSNFSVLSKMNSDRQESQENLHDLKQSTSIREVKNLISRTSILVSSGNLKGSYLARILNADKNNLGYLDRFREITGTTGNLTRENLREFLNKRYAADLTEGIIKWIYPGMSSNIENWILNIQKFVSLPDEKHFRLVFELFDTNKDHFICNSDTFHMVLLDHNRHFTPDIISITNKLEEKLRNESKLSPPPIKILTPAQKLRQINEEKKTRHLPVFKPDALNFEEFISVRFKYLKPVSLIDIIEYISGITIIDVDLPIKVPRNRRKSEDIIKEMTESYQFREEISKDSQYKYYLELSDLVKAFGIRDGLALLEKFNAMICKSYENSLVSKNSVAEAWPGFFGVDCQFINQSFYQFLAGPENRDVTKISFLKRLKILFDNDSQNFFAFCIYDRNKDGFITCDEINDLMNGLRENSFLLRECVIIANEFAASIFGKRVKPINKIDYQKFCEMIPRSVFIDEFRKALIQDKPQRRNLCFLNADQLDEQEVEYFLNFSHLNKKIVLGEVSSDIVVETK